jgi:two-component system sensor histidine kinase KdpD
VAEGASIERAGDSGVRAGGFGAAGRYTVTLLALAVLTVVLLPLRDRLGLLDIGLFYLLVVALCAAAWGWEIGFAASVVAYLALDYFFVPPFHHVLFGEPDHVIALLGFLGVASVTSALLARARAGEARARRREMEAVTLYDLARQIIAQTNLTTTLTTLCARVCSTFGAESCAVLRPDPERPDPIAWSGRGVGGPSTPQQRRSVGEALATGRTRVVPATLDGDDTVLVYLPLCASHGVVGVLQVALPRPVHRLTEHDHHLLEAFAGVAVLAVDRDHLLTRSAHAEALQETDRLRSALLSAVSHDLRTPLASIKWSVSSLLQPDVQWTDADRREFLTAIDEETDRLTAIIRNLLDLSRIEAGAVRPQRAWYDVRELLETMVSRLARTIPGHRLTIETAPDVGEARFDYVQIGQVLANLIENAAKFAPPNTEIRVSARRLDGVIEIAVEDAGPGIPPDERERIFEPFYRRGQTGERTPGSGLGLTISRGLIEAHRGSISVGDAPGGGARVAFRLPAELPPPPSYIPPALVAR